MTNPPAKNSGKGRFDDFFNASMPVSPDLKKGQESSPKPPSTISPVSTEAHAKEPMDPFAETLPNIPPAPTAPGFGEYFERQMPSAEQSNSKTPSTIQSSDADFQNQATQQLTEQVLVDQHAQTSAIPAGQETLLQERQGQEQRGQDKADSWAPAKGFQQQTTMVELADPPQPPSPTEEFLTGAAAPHSQKPGVMGQETVAGAMDPAQLEASRQHAARRQGAPVYEGLQLGDFRLESKLGQGGMGEVYRATQISLDRAVAVKVLPQGLAHQSQFADRFEREAKSAARLIHPNVIQVYAFGIVQDIPYFAMELVEGEDLHERLTREGQLPLDDIMNIMTGVASALAAAGDKELVHRDIKPSNVMLAGTGQIKVMDFGLAKATSMASASLTQSGLIMGTPKYMSPEQARGDSVDKRTDIYSLGIVFYELLTGQLPFRSDTPAGLVFKHVYEAPPPPRTQNDSIPPFLEEVVLRMLEKDPDERYSSAHELLKDLKEFQLHKDHYMGGGERLEGSKGDSARLPENVRRDPPIDAPPPKTEPTRPSHESSGLRFFIILLLLLIMTAGLAYLGHKEGHWVIPYLPPPKKPKLQKDPKPKPDPKPVKVDPPKPKKVDFALKRKDLNEVEVTWNGIDPKDYFPFKVASFYSVKPGNYTFVFKKKGRLPIQVEFVLDDNGQALTVDSKLNVNDMPLTFRPHPDLLASYEKGLEQLSSEKYAEALASFTKAKSFDPEFKNAEDRPTASEALEQARARLKEQRSNEKAWNELFQKGQDALKSKNWREALEFLKNIPKDSVAHYAECQKTIARLEGQLKQWKKDRETAYDSLRVGQIDLAVKNLKPLVEQDSADQEAKQLLEKCTKASELQTLMKGLYDKGMSERKQEQFKVAVQTLTTAKGHYDTYLKLYSPDDESAKQQRQDIVRILAKSGKLGDLVKKLKDAEGSKYYEKVIEIADTILSIDADNSVARQSRDKADYAMKRLEINETMAGFDKAIAGKSPVASLKFFSRDSEALYKSQKQTLQDFSEVARFAQSQHKILSMKRLKNGVRVDTEWTFLIDFFLVNRKTRSARKVSITFQKVRVSGKVQWLITELKAL